MTEDFPEIGRLRMGVSAQSPNSQARVSGVMNDGPKPWADLSSAERLDAILVAMYLHEKRTDRGARAGRVALEVMRVHPMKMPRFAGRPGRQMSEATRVTPGIVALRNRGLIASERGDDGLWDRLTEAGLARVRELGWDPGTYMEHRMGGRR